MAKGGSLAICVSHSIASPTEADLGTPMPIAAGLKVGLLSITLSLLVGARALADSLKLVDVPAGDLTQALELLEKQSGVEIVYRPEVLKGLHTDGVKGTLASKDAVARLLKGTNLKIHSDK